MSQLGTIMNPLITEAEELLIETLAFIPLASAVIAQYQNSVVLTEATLLSDLQLCTFDGYVQQTVAGWRAPYTNLEQQIVISPSIPATFSCTGGVTVNTVYGTAVLSANGATLLAAASYANPILPLPGNAWQVTAELSLHGSLSSCDC